MSNGKNEIMKEIKYLDSLACMYVYDYCDPKHCICSKKSKLKSKIEQK